MRIGTWIVGTVVLLLAACASTPRSDASAVAEPADRDLLARLQRFEFRSNLHVNLHHFLHAMARAEDAGDALLHTATPPLDAQARATLQSAVAYYREQLATRDLLFDGYLTNVKYHLLRHDSEAELAPGRLEPGLHAALLAARPVYERHFWPAHDASNRQLLAATLPLIRKIEAGTLARVEAMAAGRYPQRVLVHLSWVANPQGAYTSIHPYTVAVIASRRGETAAGRDDFVELVFHEPTHAVILPGEGAVAAAIAAAAERLGVPAPRHLWHAILFYFVGAAVDEQLARHGREDYEMYMKRHDVFSAFHDAVFAAMPPYVSGDATLEEAAGEAIRRLQAGRRAAPGPIR